MAKCTNLFLPCTFQIDVLQWNVHVHVYLYKIQCSKIVMIRNNVKSEVQKR